MKSLTGLLAALARRQRVELPPDWADPVAGLEGAATDREALARVCAALGWSAPVELREPPRPQHFPLLVRHPVQGWAIADQWQTQSSVRAMTATGPQSWSLQEARLEFYRFDIPGQRARHVRSQSLAIFLRALLSRRRMLVEATVATAMLTLVSLGVSLFSMQVYDRVIPQGGLATLWVLLAGVLFAIGIEFLLRWLRAISLEREAASIDAEVSEYFFARLQSVRLDARPGSVGTLAAQMRGLEQVRAVMSAASIYFIADLPFALFMVWVVYQIGGVLAWVPLIGLPVVLLLAWLVSRAVRAETKRTQTSNYRKNGLLVETIAASEIIKATRGHWELLARWNKLVDEVNVDDERVRRWTALAQSGANCIQQAAYVTMIAVGSLAAIDGDITMGALIACSIVAGRINGPLLSQLPGLIMQWSYARSALDGLDQLLQLPLDREPDADYLRPASLTGPMVFDSVRFAYPGARTGLDIPGLSIRPGERIAVIGPVGSGKSTLLKLLAGLYRPQAGTALLAGLDLHQIAEDSLREHIAYLPQDYRLVQGTLRENLLLGRPDPGDDVLMARAAQTGLAQLIASHPQGLDMPIAEGGSGISGGQRQLVGLTRMLLADPGLWLLDEPTAALDQESEKRVLAALDRCAGSESAVVLVTHKMSLLQLVKRVIVIAGGRVVMDGPVAQVTEQLRRAAATVAAPYSVPVAGGQSA